jgi:hypothetical protein
MENYSIAARVDWIEARRRDSGQIVRLDDIEEKAGGIKLSYSFV